MSLSPIVCPTHGAKFRRPGEAQAVFTMLGGLWRVNVACPQPTRENIHLSLELRAEKQMESTQSQNWETDVEWIRKARSFPNTEAFKAIGSWRGAGRSEEKGRERISPSSNRSVAPVLCLEFCLLKLTHHSTFRNSNDAWIYLFFGFVL